MWRFHGDVCCHLITVVSFFALLFHRCWSFPTTSFTHVQQTDPIESGFGGVCTELHGDFFMWMTIEIKMYSVNLFTSLNLCSFARTLHMWRSRSVNYLIAKRIHLANSLNTFFITQNQTKPLVMVSIWAFVSKWPAARKQDSSNKSIRFTNKQITTNLVA